MQNFYRTEDTKKLQLYYKNFLKGGAHYKYVQHYYTERIKHLIINMKKGKKY